MTESEHVLGQWSEDPRSFEGAKALGILEPLKPTSSNQWASKEFQSFGDEDPREVAAKAAKRDARLADRLFQPGNQPQPMRRGVERSLR